MNPDEIRAVAAQEISRRHLLQGVGAVTGAGALGVAGADPIHAATLGYDAKIGVDARTYTPPTGLARDSAPKRTALGWISRNEGTIVRLSDDTWEYAELSLREWRSQYDTAQLLRRHGFTIEWGTAGLPAAFTAVFRSGHGGPVLGFNGENDALPGLSQRKGATTHDPLVYNYDAYGPTYGSGHGDGHNCLGAATAGAAIATAQALRRHGLGATVKYFGSTGEEQLVGKAYAVRDGAYDGLDVFLDWHPLPVTDASWGPLSALRSATFTFLGAAGHGGSPLGNRSGLDGALLMAHMSEYLREKNVGPAARLHYAVINGGGAPNVTPDMCSIWYYLREGSPARAQVLYDKVVTCAEAAAAASQTRLSYRLNTAIWNMLGNKAARNSSTTTCSPSGRRGSRRATSRWPRLCSVRSAGRRSAFRTASCRWPHPTRRTWAGPRRTWATSAGSLPGWASTRRAGLPGCPITTGRPPRARPSASPMRGCWRRPATLPPPPSTWSPSPRCWPRCGRSIATGPRASGGRA